MEKIEQRAHRIFIVFCIVLLISAGRFTQAQQRKTITYSDGSKDIFDIATGWTEIDNKTGKTTNMPPTALTEFCGKDMDLAIKYGTDLPEGARRACDEWATLQPQTQIEQVPFAQLITRLLKISPPHTDFARYRGIELKTEGSDAVYDATIIPDDVGGHAVCTVVQGHDPSGGELYKYTCSVETSSYSDAITLEKILVQRLNGLGLTEDQVTEHGLVVRDKNDNECAPTGECTHSQMFSSAMKDGKIVDIEAVPDFIRNNTLADLQMFMATGRHNLPDGVKSDSGTVMFSVLSHSSGPSQ